MDQECLFCGSDEFYRDVGGSLYSSGRCTTCGYAIEDLVAIAWIPYGLCQNAPSRPQIRFVRKGNMLKHDLVPLWRGEFGKEESEIIFFKENFYGDVRIADEANENDFIFVTFYDKEVLTTLSLREP